MQKGSFSVKKDYSDFYDIEGQNIYVVCEANISGTTESDKGDFYCPDYFDYEVTSVELEFGDCVGVDDNVVNDNEVLMKAIEKHITELAEEDAELTFEPSWVEE